MEKFFMACVGLVVVNLVFLFGASVAQSFVSEQTRTCTVTEKDRAAADNGESSMRIYTEECGVVQVKDRLLRGQFDSADIYADIEPGKTYEMTTVGNRVPIFSWFPTILGTPQEVSQ